MVIIHLRDCILSIETAIFYTVQNTKIQKWRGVILTPAMQTVARFARHGATGG